MIFRCPSCGTLKITDKGDVKGLAEEALDAACLVIQNKLGQTDGGVAGHFFSDNRVQERLMAYIQTEIQWANEHATEVIDAGHQARIK